MSIITSILHGMKPELTGKTTKYEVDKYRPGNQSKAIAPRRSFDYKLEEMEQNEQLVIKAMKAGNKKQKDIGRHAQLSRGTISLILKNLMSRKIVECEYTWPRNYRIAKNANA